jgi:EmrB/QacA subfamily drug resistance transporter
MTQEALASASHARQRPARWVSGRRARVLLCASGVSFMIMLDANIVAVSLPSIARDLNATFADIEWVVSAYVLTFAALLMPSGALADRFGRRRMLVIGLAIFTVASLLCGLAPTALILNSARALQGVGAAIELSAALAVLGHEFQGAERAKAFGFWGTLVGVAVAVGPLVGGVITTTLGWRWAFLVNIPVGAALIWLAVDAVEESRDPDAQRLDVAGIVLFGGGLFFLVWALIGANVAGWSGRETLAKLSTSAVLLALFVAVELIQDRPMVDFALFRKRTFLGASFAMLGFASAAQVMMTYLPLYLQNVFNLSPAVAGLGMLPFALPLFLCPRIAVLLSSRLSGRDVLALGLAIVAAGNVATALMVGVHLPYGFVAFGMLLTGCGAGLLNGETAKVSMSVIPPERGGMASGISGTLRFVGLVTGITGLGAVLASETQRRFVHAMSALPSGSSPIGAGRQIVSRIVAGDIPGVVAQTPAPLRTAIADVSRSSFATGFSLALLVAGVVAALAAGLTFAFVSPVETAPVRLRGAPETAMPDLLD